MTPSQELRQSRRLDKWLWCARRFRTRTLAARFIQQSSVRVTRGDATSRVDWPSYQLREGDVVSYVLGESVRAYRVTGFSEKRGAPDAASRLFEIELKADKQTTDTSPPSCKLPRGR